MNPLFLAALVALGAVGIYLAASGQLSNLSSGVSNTAASFTAALMGNLSAAQIAQYASNAGWSGSDLATAVAIALAESGGNPQAYNPETAAGAPVNKGSYGLWQIYLNAHPEYAGDNLYDPQTNANDAYEIWQNAGFSAWSTYKGGQYETFLASAQSAAAGTANA
jgi:hypothetical protein